MDDQRAVLAFGALSQQTRLHILRNLVVAGPDGLAAGDIADLAGASPSNVSFHLKELERSGLIAMRRSGRSLIYSARYDTLGALVDFLVKGCCSGHPDICTALTAASNA